jgi:hypothetical protein
MIEIVDVHPILLAGEEVEIGNYVLFGSLSCELTPFSFLSHLRTERASTDPKASGVSAESFKVT